MAATQGELAEPPESLDERRPLWMGLASSESWTHYWLPDAEITTIVDGGLSAGLTRKYFATKSLSLHSML